MIHLALQVAAALFLIAVACAALVAIKFISLFIWAVVIKKKAE